MDLGYWAGQELSELPRLWEEVQSSGVGWGRPGVFRSQPCSGAASVYSGSHISEGFLEEEEAYIKDSIWRNMVPSWKERSLWKRP